MKKYFSVLKKCPLFSGIEEEKLSGLLGCLGARVVSFDKKYTVFAEDSAANYIGIVLFGRVQIIRYGYDGSRSILAEAAASEMFCEAFACAELDAIPVTVIAAEPSEIMLIDCRHILRTCQNACGFHQQLIFNLMKNLAVKNIMLHNKSEITSKRTTREKLWAYLMLEAHERGAKSFDISFNRQELADYLEVDRSGLSVEIGRLIKDGLIKSRKNHFEIL